MKLYAPQVQLFRRTYIDKPNEYFIHVITWTDYSNYKADGYRFSASPDENGNYIVDLYVSQDSEIFESESLTPIVHTISLGELPVESIDGTIEVNVMLKNPISRNSSVEKLGSIITSLSNSSEDSRPI